MKSKEEKLTEKEILCLSDMFIMLGNGIKEELTEDDAARQVELWYSKHKETVDSLSEKIALLVKESC